MKLLELTDNTIHYNSLEWDGCEDELLYLSSQTIANLKNSKGGNILVFPHSFRDCDDEVGKQRVFTLDCRYKDGQNVINSIITGNLMGFIGINGVEISISSRFSSGSKEDFFLQYMLQEVMSVNVFNLKYGMNRETDAFDLLAFMFPEFLKRAMRQGVFRKYVRHAYNDANVRGPIDVARHLRRNVPFNYRIAYTTREFDADNSVMQLIRHTIEYINGKKYGHHILHSDRDTDELVRRIIALTPTYNIRYREQVIKENLRPVNHPYYTEYTSLQKLCLQILRHDKVRYGESKDKVYGVLFDGAWLWEEYLACVFKDLNFEHPRNKEGKGRIYLCENDGFPRYPDFYKGEANSIILDAKYKRQIDTRDDVNQILTYMYRLRGKSCAFILPMDGKANDDKKWTFMGYGGDMRIIRLNVPQQTDTDFDRFTNDMKASEESIINSVRQLMDNNDVQL